MSNQNNVEKIASEIAPEIKSFFGRSRKDKLVEVLKKAGVTAKNFKAVVKELKPLVIEEFASDGAFRVAMSYIKECMGWKAKKPPKSDILKRLGECLQTAIDEVGAEVVKEIVEDYLAMD